MDVYVYDKKIPSPIVMIRAAYSEVYKEYGEINSFTTSHCLNHCKQINRTDETLT